MSGVVMKPCPWCGCPVSPLVEEGATFRWRRVAGCCADGPEVRHNTLADDQEAAKADSTAAAIEAWNTRPVEDTLRARLETAEGEAERLRGEVNAVEFAIEEATRNGEIPYDIKMAWDGVIAARTKETK